MRNDRWRIDAALGDLLRAHGGEGQARRWFSQAAELVRALAGTIDDQGLQAAFLAAEPVRHVLALQE